MGTWINNPRINTTNLPIGNIEQNSTAYAAEEAERVTTERQIGESFAQREEQPAEYQVAAPSPV
jgi:hypothetical protein